MCQPVAITGSAWRMTPLRCFVVSWLVVVVVMFGVVGNQEKATESNKTLKDARRTKKKRQRPPSSQ
jgi:hypothetical protein